MRRTFTGILAATLLMASALAVAPEAAAEETRCNSTLRARTYDNVRVPSGRTCTITGPRLIKGTLQVERGATLYAYGITVNGNIQGAGHTYVEVKDTVVGGQIALDAGGGFTLVRNAVTGSIQVKSNRGRSYVDLNRVNQDIQVFSHRNGINIYQNRVDGNLQCKENTVIRGGGNVVQGSKQDQCARF